MELFLHPSPCADARPPALLVLLPGAYSTPGEFVEAGFVQAVRQRRLHADIVIADAHLGYFIDRSVIQRLHADVVQPARARGVQQVWLVGISLGGFGAMGYAIRHADHTTGVLAIAPYLGRRGLQQEINAAGGPLDWRALNTPPREADDLDHALWTWLTDRHLQQAHDQPPLYLGAGRDDRFAAAHRQMAALLPPDRSDTVPGGHDWPPWSALWERWLDRGLLPAGCVVAADQLAPAAQPATAALSAS